MHQCTVARARLESRTGCRVSGNTASVLVAAPWMLHSPVGASKAADRRASTQLTSWEPVGEPRSQLRESRIENQKAVGLKWRRDATQCSFILGLWKNIYACLAAVHNDDHYDRDRDHHDVR